MSSGIRLGVHLQGSFFLMAFGSVSCMFSSQILWTEGIDLTTLLVFRWLIFTQLSGWCQENSETFERERATFFPFLLPIFCLQRTNRPTNIKIKETSTKRITFLRRGETLPRPYAHISIGLVRLKMAFSDRSIYSPG